MRKVSKVTAEALRQGKSIKVGNSKVKVHDDGTASYYLHGNNIAYTMNADKKLLLVSHCGWTTPTTKERLNSILSVMELPYRIHQENFTWFIRNYVTGEVTQWVERFGGIGFDLEKKCLT